MNEQQEKRDIRRKRRIKSQVIAYIVTTFFLLALATGIVFGVRFLTQRKEEEEQERQNKIEEMLSTAEPSVTAEPVPETTPEVILPTQEEKLDEIVDAVVEMMTLEEKVAGLFVVTPESITGVNTAVRAEDGTRDALAKYAVGGIVYFQKNMQSQEQLTEMLKNTAEFSRYPIFLAVDDEGGRVSRVAAAGIGESADSAQNIGATGNTDNAYQAGVKIGQTLSELGFNLDFAPVADIANVENSTMGDRAYGADAATVSGFVTAMMSGLEEQKVTACLKHFPGIGSSVQDTHDGSASTTRTEEEFRAEEFAVFQAGIDAGAKMVMVSHMAAPSLTGDNNPSIFSEKLITEILREEMGFEGVVITDALNMKAISEYYGADEAAIMALKAGCDMLLMPEDFEKAYNGVLQAVREGVISEERINDSLRRVYRIKYADRVEE